MKNTGQIVIHLEGKYGAEPLTPDNYDISLVRDVLEHASAMLDLDKKKDRPVATYKIENGSVKNVITVSKQKAVEFASILALMLSTQNPLDMLEPKTAVAFENFQNFSVQNNLSLDIHSSENERAVINITPKSKFRRTEALWVDAEVYYYGILVDAGGKNKSNIHLDTKEGSVKIEADKDYLANYNGNPLYRKFGVVAIAKQNIITGAIDNSSLVLKKLIEFEPKFDLNYLNEKIAASTPIWSGVDVDEYLQDIRGIQ